MKFPPPLLTLCPLNTFTIYDGVSLVRSGSMQGRSIEKAKEALHIFLASLPSDCMFNICSFNAGFDFLFDATRPYNDQNLADARAYTDNMIAGDLELNDPSTICSILPTA